MTEANMALGEMWPDLDTFRRLAQDRRVIPVVRHLLADGETPIGLYRKLAGDRRGSFLLESAEHDGTWSRYSIVGARSSAMLTSAQGQARWHGQVPTGVPAHGRSGEVLRETLRVLRTPRIAGLPPLTGGLVGTIGYDIVRQWEDLPDSATDDLGLPDLCVALATDLAVLDHRDSTVWLIANAVNTDGSDERVDEAWADAIRRLDAMSGELARPAPSTVATFATSTRSYRRRTEPADYEAAVSRGQRAIRDGEVFQVVLSQRFEADCPVDALEVYRCLRATNPSPYMYLIRCQDADGRPFDVVGSSPEALVKVTGGEVLAHPIAGTRPRGATAQEDAALAEDLLADAKERAEHLMLVDLARNDVGRIAVPGSVDVVQFMAVERYSHVMHLVSTVTGTARPGETAYDVLRATFPAGTLSGAPKPRAMALIDEIEPTRRGVYGGTVGYLDFDGDLDMAIAIRTAVVKDGVAYVQAGAGVVADSIPAAEQAECEAKAAAMLRAIDSAVSLAPLPGPRIGS